MKNKQAFTKNNVILNLFQDLIRFLKRNKVEMLKRVQHDILVNNNGIKAFTLIELLVVVLIIGILAAVALPQYQKAVTKSRLANLKIIVESVAQAEDRYYLANNEYTTDLQALDTDLPTAQNQEGTNPIIFSYPWGYCSLSPTNFICANTNAEINYSATFHNSLRQCSAVQTNSTSNQICKQETGKNQPNWSGISAYNQTSWHAYNY